jgi:hypothetical protein
MEAMPDIGDTDAKFFSARMELLNGEYQQALEDFQFQKYRVWRQLGAAMAEQSLDHSEKSERVLESTILQYGDSLSYQYAMTHVWRNDRDAAFRSLERGFRGYSSLYPASS